MSLWQQIICRFMGKKVTFITSDDQVSSNEEDVKHIFPIIINVTQSIRGCGIVLLNKCISPNENFLIMLFKSIILPEVTRRK